MKACLSLVMSMFLGASSVYAGLAIFAYEGWTSVGHDYDSYSTESEVHCAQTCLKNEICSLAVFDKTEKRCLLKSASGEWEHAPSTLFLKIIAGQNNVDFIKGDYRYAEACSWDKCSRICFEEAECKAFTFNKTTKACWLKNEIVYKERNNNAISGVR